MHVHVTLREIQTIWQANKFTHIPLGTVKHNSLQTECKARARVRVRVCVCVGGGRQSVGLRPIGIGRQWRMR